jgi:hypothetical protein
MSSAIGEAALVPAACNVQSERVSHRGSFDSFLLASKCRITVVLSFRGRKTFGIDPDSILGERITAPIGFQRIVHLGSPNH